MHLPGCDGQRPDGAVVVVPDLAHACGQAAHADAVAPHYRRFFRTVRINITHAHGLCILGAQLKDIAHLYAAGHPNGRPAAHRTHTAVRQLGKIVIFHRSAVPFKLQARTVESLPVCPADEIARALQGCVIQHRHPAAQPHRTDKARAKATFRRNSRRPDIAAQIIGQLGLVRLQVAPQKQHHIAAIRLLLVYHSLAALRGYDMQKGAQRLNGVRVRRFHRLQRLQNCGRLIVRHTGRSLHIGTVAAGAATESSPAGVNSMNSWERLPPIMPESDATETTSGRPARAKMRS